MRLRRQLLVQASSPTHLPLGVPLGHFGPSQAGGAACPHRAARPGCFRTHIGEVRSCLRPSVVPEAEPKARSADTNADPSARVADHRKGLRHMPKADPRELKARAGGPKNGSSSRPDCPGLVAGMRLRRRRWPPQA